MSASQRRTIAPTIEAGLGGTARPNARWTTASGVWRRPLPMRVRDICARAGPQHAKRASVAGYACPDRARANERTGRTCGELVGDWRTYLTVRSAAMLGIMGAPRCGMGMRRTTHECCAS